MKETAVLKIAYISRVLKKLTNIHLHYHLRGSLCNKFGASCLKPVYSFVFFMQDKRTGPFSWSVLRGVNSVIWTRYFILLIYFDHTTHILTTSLSFSYITFSPSNIRVSTYQYKICKNRRLQILRLDLFCT